MRQSPDWKQRCQKFTLCTQRWNNSQTIFCYFSVPYDLPLSTLSFSSTYLPTSPLPKSPLSFPHVSSLISCLSPHRSYKCTAAPYLFQSLCGWKDRRPKLTKTKVIWVLETREKCFSVCNWKQNWSQFKSAFGKLVSAASAHKKRNEMSSANLQAS